MVDLLASPNGGSGHDRFGSEAPVRFAASNGCNPSEAVGHMASTNDN
jgi:hypothetical protein